MSHAPTLRVGDLLAALRNDFPSLTTSKARFLDSQGLVVPQRTSAGYRLYSAADVERLRFVLRQQRDGFVPLSVIRERLEQLDAGLSHEPLSLAAVEADRASVVSIDEAARVASTSPAAVREMMDAGVIGELSPGRIERDLLPLIAACARYLDSGADIRELRALARVAEREAEAASAAAAPLRRRDDHAHATAAENARLEAAVAVFGAAVRTHGARGL